MVDLSVSLGGFNLKNPVIPASGCFGYGREFAELYDLNMLGSFAIKGTTLESRFGNGQPRIAETASGMLNAVGLQNPGLDAVIKSEIPHIAEIFRGPVLANVCGFSPEEYAEICRRLNDCPEIGLFEINISCPNLHCGGRNFGSSAEGAAEITRAAKAVAEKPVFIKLSPNVGSIAEIAGACADAGADGLCLVNTLLGMRIDLKNRRPLLANKTGGLSGPALFPVALRMVYEVYESLPLPIIGCGGVASAEDLCEMMMAGASAVEIGAANLRNPYICKEIVERLPALCKELGVESIAELTGAAHN